MTTARNAAEALRKARSFLQRPREWENARYLALQELNEQLKGYAEKVPEYLSCAYDSWTRHQNWYPIPFSVSVLPAKEAYWLQIERERARELILTMKGFSDLQKAAEDAGVLLTLCILPGSASVICDFLAAESKAELVIL